MKTSGVKSWPLTPAQHGIWVGQNMSVGSARYNTAEYIEIDGPLDQERFFHVVKSVLESAFGLNLKFDRDYPTHGEVNNEHIESEDVVKLDKNRIDFCQMLDYSNESNPREKAISWMRQDLKKMCNISTGQNYSFGILKVGQQSWFFYLKIHHIACDGYGFALITDTIVREYESSRGKKELFGNYHRAITEQLLFDNTEACKNAEKYWLEKISELKHPPSFSPKNEDVADGSIRTTCRISFDLKQQLDEMANKLVVNWTDLVIACVIKALAERRHCTQVSMGMPVMNRFGTPAMNVPMMCMNIVPLIVDLPENLTFSQLAGSVAQTIRDDRPYHRYRYENLKAIARKDRINKHGQLWGPVVNVMPFSRHSSMSACELLHQPLSAGPVEDISISFSLGGKGDLLMIVDANPNRYQIEQVNEIRDILYSYFVDMDSLELSKIGVDRKNISWLSTPRSKEQPSVNTLWQKILKTEKRLPEKSALVFAGATHSYRQLIETVQKLADELEKFGLKKGHLCALALDRSDIAIVCCLSCLKIGSPFVFIDPKSAAERNLKIINDCKPSLTILNEDCARTDWVENSNSIILKSDLSLESLGGMDLSNQVQKYEGISYLIYTSGSSGTPKGVLIEGHSISDFVSSAIDVYQINESDRVLQFAPLHFDACLEEIFCSLCSGATLVLRDHQTTNSFEEFCHFCDKWDISVLDLPTAFWHELGYALKHQNLSLPESVSKIVIGGEAVRDDLLRLWLQTQPSAIKLFNSYGPTEATVVATVQPLHSDGGKLLTSIGSPLPGRSIAIVDENLNILPMGEQGELLLLGVGLAHSYLNLPKLTASSFIYIKLPWEESSVRAYRTGDQAKIDCDGELVYLGRIDNQIKISGQRISPSEIESVLQSLPGVVEAAVTAKKSTLGTQMHAHLAGPEIDKHIVDIDDLRSLVKDKLPAVMIPNSLFKYNKLIKSKSGKIDRKTLAEIDNPNKFDADLLDPVKNLWREILGDQDFDGEDDFFSLGGQSLQVIQLASRLSSLCGRNISANTLFQNPTLTDMYSAVFDEGKVKVDFDYQKQKVERDCELFRQELSKVERDMSLSTLVPIDQPKTILLTGATGFLGAHLLSEILHNSHDNVICLVRGESEPEASEKLTQTMLSYGFNVKSEWWERVELAVVDLGDIIQLPSKLEKLAFYIDQIIHSAATTSVTRDYQSLANTNTFSTGEMLKLAKKYGFKFKYISTVAVSPPHSQGDLLEERYIPFHKSLSDGYQQSKWASENMVEEAIKQGVSATTYRLGRICGSLKTGYVNENDLVWQILRLSIEYGIAPDLQVNEPWTPVDEVAKFILLEDSLDRIYNVIPDELIGFTNLVNYLNECGYMITPLPITDWCETIKRVSKENALPVLAFFEQKLTAGESGYESRLSEISSTVFKAKCSEHDYRLSPIGKDELKRYLGYLADQGLIVQFEYNTQGKPSGEEVVNG